MVNSSYFCGDEPGWLERVAQSIIRWLEDDVEEVKGWVKERLNERKKRREIAEEAIRCVRFWSGNVGFPEPDDHWIPHFCGSRQP